MRRLIRAALISATLTQASAAVSADWLPVRETSLTLQPGSPLDFSGILPNIPISGKNRLVAGNNGRIATSGAPDMPQRLLCASLGWSPASGGFPDHAEADVYARQLAMHGYNIARFHFVDASLMYGRNDDFDFDPEILDRLHYLMAALKRNGISWVFDGLTSWRGGFGAHDDRWSPSPGLKLEINFEDKAFAHWKRMITSVLGRVNPYTGVAPLKDDALSMVVMVNEDSVEFETVVHEKKGQPHYPENLRLLFNAWLRKTYVSTAALRTAWPDIAANERLENRSVQMPADRYPDSPRVKDVQAFFVELETRTIVKMTETMRGLGYRGILTTYNNWPTVQTGLSRASLQAVTMNTYQDGVSGYEPGSTIENKSSIADAAAYVRHAAASRWLGKPFGISEFDHLFWNSYRYEAGLAMPAYAALQGWDMLCRHAHGPIVLNYGEPYPHKRAMLPYAIALDPVARATETLAALVYRRGDASEALNVIPFAVRGIEDLNDDMQAAEPDSVTWLSLVSRIGLAKSDGMRQPLAINQPRETADAAGMLASLKTAGLLPGNNRTDAETGIFESDTGEILLDRQKLDMTLQTPLTVAAAFANLNEPIDLGAMKVTSAEGGALVSASVIDGAASLRDSKRMLLIYATDARNTGMTFRDREQKVIEDFGTLPVLIRKSAAELTFPGKSARWRLSPIGLDGTVHAPVASGNGEIAFRLSNDTPAGPTTFFLLETD